MARSLVFLTIFYVLGIVLGRYCFSYQASLYLLCGAAAWFLFNFISKSKGLQVFVSLLVLFLAVGSLALNFSLQKTVGNIRAFHGEKCGLTGMIEDEPLWREDDVVFPLRPEKLVLKGKEHSVSGTVRVVLRLRDFQWDGGSVPTGSEKAGEGKNLGTDEGGRARTWYAGNDKSYPESLGNKACNADLYFLSYGRQVSLQGVLYEPQEQRNPGGFAYRDYLETQGMTATFYGVAKDTVDLGLAPGLSSLRRAALQVKEKMSAVLRAYLPVREGNLLVGMLFGERRALDPEVENFFARSGVAHLLAVSGLHVGLVAGFFLLFWRRIAGQGWCSFLLSVLFLFLYVFLCGLKPAALRSLLMFILAGAALFLGRRNDLPTALAAAALVTLFYRPLYLFSVGFQLSYTATAGLIFFAPYLQEKIGALLTGWGRPAFIAEKITPLLAVTIAAQIGVLPLTAYYFREISLIALLTNVLILPVMALILGIGLVAALLGLFLPVVGAFFNLANYPLLAYVLFVTSQAGALPFSYCQVYPPRLLELGLYYALFVALAAGGKKYFLYFYQCLPGRVRLFHFLIVFLVAALIFTWWGALGAGRRPLEVVFLDVGQGDAIFMQTPRGKNILLDAGGKPVYKGNIAETGHLVVVPFLEHRRIKKLDLVIISHPHEDHYGGLFAVLEKIPVKMLAINDEIPEEGPYPELLALARDKGISREILGAGDYLTVEPALEIRVLNPPRELWQGTGSNTNNNSLVVHLRYKDAGLLLTGDVETTAVEFLLKQGDLPLYQVLKIPHHGSALASLPSFLDKFPPWAAVISVGPNSFGHPHADTLAALEERGLQIFRTDWHGAVTFKTKGYVWEAKTMLPLQKAAER